MAGGGSRLGSHALGTAGEPVAAYCILSDSSTLRMDEREKTCVVLAVTQAWRWGRWAAEPLQVWTADAEPLQA